jgi:hypothetical protein
MKINIKKTIGLLAVLLFIGLIFNPLLALAQDNQEKPKIQVTLGSSFTLMEGRLVSKKDNKYEIQFKIKNDDQIRSGIKYSINLLKDGNNIDIVDGYTYPDEINLREGETFSQRVTFYVPPFLNGDYNLVLSFKDKDGTPILNHKLADLQLKGSNEYIELDPNRCNLQVEGEENQTYNLVQGVDIREDEKLLIVCNVKNLSQRQINATPEFETYYRSEAGNMVVTKPVNHETQSIEPGQEKEIILEVPQALEPQGYDVKLMLQEGNNRISNTVKFHYVLKGVSATISEITINDNYYIEGDDFKATMIWYKAADAFPGARHAPTQMENTSLEFQVLNKNRQPCIDKIERPIGQNNNVEETINAQVLRECEDPYVLAAILSSEGKLLTKKEIQVKTKDKEEAKVERQEQKEQIKEKKTNLVVFIVLTIALLILILIFFMKDKFLKKTTKLLILFSMMSFGLFGFSLNSVEAAVGDAQPITPYTADIKVAGFTHEEKIGVTVGPLDQNNPTAAQLLFPNYVIGLVDGVPLEGSAERKPCTEETANPITPGKPLDVITMPAYLGVCGNFDVSLKEAYAMHDSQRVDIPKLGDGVQFTSSADDRTVHEIKFKVTVDAEFIRGDSTGIAGDVSLEGSFCYKVDTRDNNNLADYQCRVYPDPNYRSIQGQAYSVCGVAGNQQNFSGGSSIYFVRGNNFNEFIDFGLKDESELSTSDFCAEGYQIITESPNPDDAVKAIKVDSAGVTIAEKIITRQGETGARDLLRDEIVEQVGKGADVGLEYNQFVWKCNAGNISNQEMEDNNLPDNALCFVPILNNDPRNIPDDAKFKCTPQSQLSVDLWNSYTVDDFCQKGILTNDKGVIAEAPPQVPGEGVTRWYCTDEDHAVAAGETIDDLDYVLQCNFFNTTQISDQAEDFQRENY